jgi:hypothetical protein
MIQHSEACERNKEPILQILRRTFSASSAVLEIGGGTGQHAVFFATHLEHIRWQPTDRADVLDALDARVKLEGPGNCESPVELDVDDRPWSAAIAERRFDAVFTANTLHIMSWSSVENLFDGIGPMLADGGLLCVYGPFKYAGRFTAPSNERFDQALRARDPLSGIRDFQSVNDLAVRQGLALLADHAMPANNQLLVWRQSGRGAEDSCHN